MSQSFTKPINARKLFTTQKKNLDIYPNKWQNKTTQIIYEKQVFLQKNYS